MPSPLKSSPAFIVYFIAFLFLYPLLLFILVWMWPAPGTVLRRDPGSSMHQIVSKREFQLQPDSQLPSTMASGRKDVKNWKTNRQCSPLGFKCSLDPHDILSVSYKQHIILNAAQVSLAWGYSRCDVASKLAIAMRCWCYCLYTKQRL